jgi:hypothetical protein
MLGVLETATVADLAADGFALRARV